MWSNYMKWTTIFLLEKIMGWIELFNLFARLYSFILLTVYVD